MMQHVQVLGQVNKPPSCESANNENTIFACLFFKEAEQRDRPLKNKNIKTFISESVLSFYICIPFQDGTTPIPPVHVLRVRATPISFF